MSIAIGSAEGTTKCLERYSVTPGTDRFERQRMQRSFMLLPRAIKERHPNAKEGLNVEQGAGEPLWTHSQSSSCRAGDAIQRQHRSSMLLWKIKMTFYLSAYSARCSHNRVRPDGAGQTKFRHLVAHVSAVDNVAFPQ